MANILPRVAGLFMAEGGKVDDDSLVHDTGSRCPNQNLADPARRIWVFTTASLPWMTGTAVNPLLRAAHLTRGREKGKVTLGVPWLEQEDQARVYPTGKRYETKEDQAAYVREWLVKAGLGEESSNLDLLFYPARYHEQFGSIFPMGDLAAQVPDEEADVAVLEEPEHLNFFRAEGVPWLEKFEYVVGIIHTNYQFYASTEKHGRVKKPIVRAACAFTVRAHCHRIIKLSDALQGYAKEKEMVENVHGVRPQFLEVGDEALKNGFTADAYFIGKVLWTKGIDILLALMHNARVSGGDDSDDTRDPDVTLGAIVADAPAAAAKLDEQASSSPPPPPPPSTEEAGSAVEEGRGGGGSKPFPVVLYGNGSDLDEVKAKVDEMDLPVTFRDAIDHAELGKYKVFVNPSQSEVLCTTIAEALAMGKWVVCARHPSNEFFFSNFDTCLSFSDEHEFLACMKKALAEDPPALSQATRHKLSWAAATNRFLAAASRSEVPGRYSASKSARGLARLDKLLAALHQHSMKGKRGDLLRQALGGGPVAKQNKFTEENASAPSSASSSAQSSPKDSVKKSAEQEEGVAEDGVAKEAEGQLPERSRPLDGGDWSIEGEPEREALKERWPDYVGDRLNGLEAEGQAPQFVQSFNIATDSRHVTFSGNRAGKCAVRAFAALRVRGTPIVAHRYLGVSVCTLRCTVRALWQARQSWREASWSCAVDSNHLCLSNVWRATMTASRRRLGPGWRRAGIASVSCHTTWTCFASCLPHSWNPCRLF